MPYSRRQKKLASILLQEAEKEGGEEIRKEDEEKTFNLMKMESRCVRGWWKVQYYDKKISEWTDGVSI